MKVVVTSDDGEIFAEYRVEKTPKGWMATDLELGDTVPLAEALDEAVEEGVS
jgi:hypothetical protein